MTEYTSSFAYPPVKNGRLKGRNQRGRIGQLTKKLPNPIRRYTTAPIPPSNHFHIPERMSHCRSREMAASYTSAAPDVSVDSSYIQRSSSSKRRRKAGGCKQISER